MPEDLWAGINDLARRERQQLQPMLRDVLQAVVDGDDPGRVVSAGTREAIDALRDEQRQGAAALERVVLEGLESVRNEQRREGDARAQLLTECIYALRDELDRVPKRDAVEWADLRAAISRLEENLGQLKAGVDRLPELHKLPVPDKARRGRRVRFSLGGGGK